jgi:hypothetical protein
MKPLALGHMLLSLEKTLEENISKTGMEGGE